MLTLEDAQILIELRQDGPRSLDQLQTAAWGFDTATDAETSFRVRRLEQAGLIHGFGLPKVYGTLASGDRAVEEFRRSAAQLVALARN